MSNEPMRKKKKEPIRGISLRKRKKQKKVTSAASKRRIRVKRKSSMSPKASSAASKQRFRIKRSSWKKRKNKYYRSIQKLLLIGGHKTTIKEIKSVPFIYLIKYIRRNFEPKIVLKYLPSKVVYKKRKNDLHYLITKLNWKYEIKNDQISPEIIEHDLPELPPRLPHPEYEDIYQPASTLMPNSAQSTEIQNSAQSTEIQNINAIFASENSVPFDPGILTMVVDNLPAGYSIPDPVFTSSLNNAQKEVVLAAQAGIFEINS